MNDIAQTKAALRQEILRNRKQEKLSENANFTSNLLKVVEEVAPKRVAIFESYSTEPNTAEFIENLDIPVLIPQSNNDGTLTWREQKTGLVTQIQLGDLMFIPALAIDKAGNRLGRGKGFFDRELDAIPENVLVYGVIFDCEYIQHVPAEAHDRKVIGVVTERAYYKIK